jgi:hypothetical protein
VIFSPECFRGDRIKAKFRSLGIVLVLVVVLVLGASTFCAGKDYRLSCNYFVPLVWLSNIRTNYKDEDDDEHEDDSSTSEFRFKLAPRPSRSLALPGVRHLHWVIWKPGLQF